VLQLFLGMKNTHDSYHVAEKSVDRIKNMGPVQLGKMIQPGTELWKIIDQMLVIRMKIFKFVWKKQYVKPSFKSININIVFDIDTMST